jgi:ParB family chromosome partitioning protein
VENLQRQDLNPIEEAEGYKRLMEEFGLTQEQLGTAVGKSRSHVANIIRLLQLPPSVRAEVQAGKLTAGHARALLAHANPEEAARLVIAKGLNVRQTEGLTTNTSLPLRRTRRHGRATRRLTRSSAISLKSWGLRCRSRSTVRAAPCKIAYRSLDQLDGLIALLSR